MRPALLLGLALALGAAAPRGASAALRTSEAGRTFEVRTEDGETWCTLVGDFALLEVVAKLSERMELELSGAELLPREARVEVCLKERRASDALTYLLGGFGLRAERNGKHLSLRAFGEASATGEPERAKLELAALAYMRVARNFPEHPAMPAILLAQAQIQRQVGRVSSARSQYEELVDRFPYAEETTQALYELGLLLMEQREFDTAAAEFAEFLRFERGSAEERTARLNLAHCKAELGQFEDALLIVQALDSMSPPESPEDRQERLYSRARFLVGLDRPAEALESLDRADSFGIDDGPIWKTSVHLRALALEAAERPDEASRAWLAYQSALSGEERGAALAEAARTALASGRSEDHLAVLFIGRLAERLGFQEHVQSYVTAAEEALGLGDSAAGGDLAGSLEAARALAAEGLHAEVLAALEPLREARASLGAEQALAYTELRARALASTQSLSSAVAFLRSEAARTPEPAYRRPLYVLAADLYAAQGRWREEIEALQGRL